MLLKSRKFWLMVADVVVSLATYFISKYASPETSKDVLMVIGAMQPVVITLIASITVQNVAGINSTAKTQSAKISGAADVAVANSENADVK
jgi:hypothetical protein